MLKEKLKYSFFTAKVSLIALAVVFGIIFTFGLTCTISIGCCAQSSHTRGGIFGLQTAVVSDNIYNEYEFNETVIVRNANSKDLKKGDYITYGNAFNKSLNDENFGVVVLIFEGEKTIISVTGQFGNNFVPAEKVIGIVAHTSNSSIAMLNFLCSPYMYALFVGVAGVCLLVSIVALVYVLTQGKRVENKTNAKTQNSEKSIAEPTQEQGDAQITNSKAEAQTTHTVAQTNADSSTEAQIWKSIAEPTQEQGEAQITNSQGPEINTQNNPMQNLETADMSPNTAQKRNKKEFSNAVSRASEKNKDRIAQINGYAQVTYFDINEKKEKQVEKKIIISKTAEKAIVDDAIKPKTARKHMAKPQEYSLIIAKPRSNKDEIRPVPKSNDNVPLKEILSKTGSVADENDARKDLLDKMRNKIIY